MTHNNKKSWTRMKSSEKKSISIVAAVTRNEVENKLIIMESHFIRRKNNAYP